MKLKEMTVTAGLKIVKNFCTAESHVTLTAVLEKGDDEKDVHDFLSTTSRGIVNQDIQQRTSDLKKFSK